MARTLRGVYTAQRAAMLSGVPISTVYYWATHDVLEPSLSPTRPKLWTYADVVGLRIISWLRHDKVPEAPSSSMPEVRRALSALKILDEELGGPNVQVNVDSRGQVFIKRADELWRPVKGRQKLQPLLTNTLDPLVEYRDSTSGSVGPDLRRPRPLLQIIPGKLSGEPHVENTRIGSAMIAGLVTDGLAMGEVRALYPDLSEDAVAQCVDLEEQLDRNAA